MAESSLVGGVKYGRRNFKEETMHDQIESSCVKLRFDKKELKIACFTTCALGMLSIRNADVWDVRELRAVARGEKTKARTTENHALNADWRHSTFPAPARHSQVFHAEPPLSSAERGGDKTEKPPRPHLIGVGETKIGTTCKNSNGGYTALESHDPCETLQGLH